MPPQEHKLRIRISGRDGARIPVVPSDKTVEEFAAELGQDLCPYEWIEAHDPWPPYTVHTVRTRDILSIDWLP